MTTVAAVEAATNSPSSTREWPPGLYAANRIWSFLKSVGLRKTRTPLDSSHRVTPSSGISAREATDPGVGSSGSSGRSAPWST